MGYAKPALITALAGAAMVPHLLFALQPYFIDENAILLNAIQFISEKTLVPVHVKYPTLYSYLVFPFIAASLPIEVLFGDPSHLQARLTTLFVLRPMDMALPARLFSLCLLGASAVTTYRMISCRKGALAGLAAASILLLSPALLNYGSYALPDVAVLAFSTLSFAQLLKFTDQYPDPSAVRGLLWASAMAGLAISCKYNAVSLVIPIAIAIAALKTQHRLGLGRAMSLLSAAALCCVVAFFAGSPGWLLAPLHFAVGLAFELQHAAAGHLGASGIPVLGHLELLAYKAPAMLLTGIAGVAVWWRGRTTDGWIALAAMLGSIALSALSAKQSLHYLYPGFVGWLYFSGIFTAAAAGAARSLALVILVATTAMLYAGSLSRGINYLAPNTIELAETWIYRNIPRSESIATDWAYVPYLYSQERLEALRASFGRNSEPIIEEILQTRKLYDVVRVRYDVAWLTETEATLIATSDGVFARFFCAGMFTNRMPGAESPIRPEFDRRRRFYEALFQSADWRIVQEFVTGNGPRTYLFARQSSIDLGAAKIESSAPFLPRCG